jgi:hypothetical protein
LARALIVGCGCLGTSLGLELAEDGWAVRGTARTQAGAERITKAGLEGVVADPDRVGTVLEHVGDVAVVAWALGAAGGPTAADVNGPRLERMLERVVDTPVRGFVLDAPPERPEGAELVAVATATWRLPTRVVEIPRSDSGEWIAAMRAAINDLIGADG